MTCQSEVALAILKVAQAGHPVLRMIAQPIDPTLIPSAGFQGFLDDLLETMEEYDGAGLAAPQVHASVRAVVLTLDDERGPEFLINPEIEPLTETRIRTVEGCLSLEGIRAAVHRPGHIRLRALGRHGERIHYELSGFPAVVTQHECDHLDGILFLDRCDPRTIAFLPEYERYGALDRFAADEPSEPPTDLPDQVIVLSDAEVD